MHYRELFEHCSDGVFLIDVSPEGRFTIAGFNPVEEQLVGLKSADVVGRDVEDILPLPLAERLLANYRACVKACAQVSYDEMLELPAGRRYLQTTLIPVKGPRGVHRIVGIARDVTGRVEAESAVRASGEMFRQLAENIRDVFWMIRPEPLSVLYVSPGYEQLWGRSAESVTSNPLSWLEAIHREDRGRVAEALRTKLMSGAYNETYRIVRPDGSERWIRQRAFPVPSTAGVDRVVAMAEDITEVRMIEDQLHHAQKMEAVGRLAGGVAHDFNNLLSVILSSTWLMSEQLDPSHPMRAHVADIKASADRAAELTRQLLAFSRRQTLRLETVDLNQVLTSTGKLLQRLIGEDIEITNIPFPSPAKVKVDPGQIEQVIMNLAVNARDAMPRGGKMTIEIGHVHLDEEYAAQHAGVATGPYFMLAVSDTGVGMDRATRERIFEPFFTTKEVGKGTGLGLSTVFGIVQQSGGNIWVYSEPGKGTTFKIYLPPAFGNALVEPSRIEQHATDLRGTETILLVEDEERLRRLARTILVRHGYDVLEAENAGEALLQCEQHRGPIGLLLTDVVMPRMNGVFLASRLSSMRPDLRVAFMSGYTDNAPALQGLVEPGQSFIQKPFTPEVLLRRVREALEGAPFAASRSTTDVRLDPRVAPIEAGARTKAVPTLALVR